MSQATSINTVVQGFFYDVAFHPTVEIFSSLMNYVGQNDTRMSQTTPQLILLL